MTPPKLQGAASRSSRRKKGKNPENEGLTTPSDQSKSFDLALSKMSETTISKTKRSFPAGKDFRTEVLTPRCINIERPPPIDVYKHFDVPVPNSAKTRIEHFQKVRNIQHTVVWLEPTNEFIEDVVREYDCMRLDQESEAEFAAYAIEVIFKRDPRARIQTFDNSNRGWRTKRRLQLVDKGSDTNTSAFWRPPPVICNSSDATGVILPADSTSQRESPSNTSEAQYGFDIRTDCAYYLSTQGFNRRHLSKIERVAHVIKRSSICPYLTIEFKKDGSTSETAENQLVTAAAMALFNRFLLRQTRLQQRGEKCEGQHVKGLKHYGLTFEGPEFRIWCVTPRLVVTDDKAQVQWKGCTMTEVSGGTCHLANDVEEMINWINEIHAWGLVAHAFGVENDVKFLLGATTEGGARVSAAHEDIDTWRI